MGHLHPRAAPLERADCPSYQSDLLGGWLRSAVPRFIQVRHRRPIQRRGDTPWSGHAEAVGEPLDLPETGYAVEYQGIPETLAEMEQKRKNVLELMGAGLLSRVDAYQQLNPGTSDQEAREALASIDAQSKPDQEQ